MITRSDSRCQTPAWQRSLAQAFTDPAALLSYLGLPASSLRDMQPAAEGFALRVPREYAAKMEKGNPRDPLLLQVLPRSIELADTPGFRCDPIGDRDARTAPAVLEKYRGRALLLTASSCAVHCRYCFRRHFPYSESIASDAHRRQALEYLAHAPEIHEVILSGGDPLVLSDAKLALLLREIATLSQVSRLRIHTRLPVVLPQRVTPELLAELQASRLPVVVVIHANHGREITSDVVPALLRLRSAGVVLLNQSVLLRDVNDSPAILAELSERLFHAGVLPYYLHLLDRVRGAAHFEVADARARAIHRELRALLPGYLVPRLVRETEYGEAKEPLAP